MFEPIYVCRGTYYNQSVMVVLAKIGIVKLTGCCFFIPALKKRGDYGSSSRSEIICLATCRKRYGSIPKIEEAWLVEEGRKYINWTRVDQNLHLLNEDGSIVKQSS